MLGKSQFLRKLEENWSRLYRMAYAWSHDPQLSQDIVQEAMSKALKNYRQLKQPEAFDAWVFKILANCWYDVCRLNKKMAIDLDSNQLTEMAAPEQEQDRNDIIRVVHQAMAKLSNDQRQIITLVDLEGMSYNDVGEILGIPIGTVMSRLCRARNNLKQILEEFESGENRQDSNIWRIK